MRNFASQSYPPWLHPAEGGSPYGAVALDDWYQISANSNPARVNAFHFGTPTRSLVSNESGVVFIGLSNAYTGLMPVIQTQSVVEENLLTRYEQLIVGLQQQLRRYELLQRNKLGGTQEEPTVFAVSGPVSAATTEVLTAIFSQPITKSYGRESDDEVDV